MTETKLLSYAQKEILQIEQYYENTSISNIAGVVHMKNDVSYDEINEAFNEIVQQHDTLRIRITKEDGVYKQYVVDYEHEDFEFVDFYQDQEGYEKWIKETASTNIFNLDDKLYKTVVFKYPEGYMVSSYCNII